jgi:hypothetical protein
MTRPAVATCAGVLAAFLAVAPATRAADKPRETKPAPAKPTPLLLSPAQLRECLAQQQNLRSRADETERTQAALTTSKAEIDRLGIALKEQLETLDRTSADAVAAYNAQVATRDKLIDQYQEGVPAFNAQVETLKSDRAVYAKTCENKRYDENDEIMIRKGK